MDSNLFFPKRPFRTRGGAKAPHRKNTAKDNSVVMPPPQTVTIPLHQNIGAPCKPAVKAGQKVFVGQVIGASEQFVSAPVHASVSGKVKSITKLRMPSGEKCDAIVIESDGKMTLDPDIKPPVVNSYDDFLSAVRQSGLIGLGGAGFPTTVKLNVKNKSQVDTIIINAAECEPYITADNREAIENPDGVMSGIYTVKKFLDVKRVLIGVEDNKPDVIKILSKIAYDETADPNNEVRVLPLKARYPQGAEKVLIKACTGRVVPEGGLPLNVGCIVLNITSVAFIAEYLKTGVPLIKKRVTIDGSAIKSPKNVIAPIGTSIREIIEFAGGYKETPKKILMGGPMMGIAIADDSMPLLKNNNAILAFAEKDAVHKDEIACIRCGRCHNACPFSLMPPLINAAVKTKDTETLQKLGVLTCMECGCCSFNCPSSRYLVQEMRLGKSILNDYLRKQKEAEKNGE